MAYDSGTIILLNFGDYAKEARRLETELPSIAQIALSDYGRFFYVSDFLSNLGEDRKSRPGKLRNNIIVIEEPDLGYIREVSDALGKFKVKVKCEGRGCKNFASHLVVPYQIDHNREEKKATGGPDFVNQTYILQSLFLCENCGDEMEFHKRGKVEKLGIGFNLPEYWTEFPAKREWNVNMGDLHTKIKKIGYQARVADAIDPGIKVKPMKTDKYTTQEVVSRLIDREACIPSAKEPYEIRKLRWHIAEGGEKLELAYQQMKRREIRSPKEHPWQPHLPFPAFH